MTIVAMEKMLHPGNIVAWIAAGLIAGWLANMVVKVAGGGGYGVVADLALGVIGALAGGDSFSPAGWERDRLLGRSRVGLSWRLYLPRGCAGLGPWPESLTSR
jgi:uncharacterized membrane protein YeaQ/YmgE (transglycosylase-associated protein family)